MSIQVDSHYKGSPEAPRYPNDPKPEEFSIIMGNKVARSRELELKKKKPRR